MLQVSILKHTIWVSKVYSQTYIQQSPLKKWPGKTGNHLFKIIRSILLVVVMICALLLPEGNYLGEKNGGYFEMLQFLNNLQLISQWVDSLFNTTVYWEHLQT